MTKVLMLLRHPGGNLFRFERCTLCSKRIIRGHLHYYGWINTHWQCWLFDDEDGTL